MANPAERNRRQRTRRFLLTVILLTIPFYVIGFAALQFLPGPVGQTGDSLSTPTGTTAPPKVSTILPRTQTTGVASSSNATSTQTVTATPYHNVKEERNQIVERKSKQKDARRVLKKQGG
ncbi:MAG: hypothetical protein MK000_00790, partial [Anaerolineales bacterium]|nr:hypothetical protein [Anaerolineales bacterium]